MKTKIILCLFLFLIIGLTVRSQNNIVKLEQIGIGDQISDYPLMNLLNYPQLSVKLTELKGKILILDFWTFGCASCVESWPKLMKLQEKYKDQMQLFLINTYDDTEKVQSFIARQEKINNYKMTLPVACGDKQLNNLFPHTSVPHVIFITESGTVKYISYGYSLNEKTINNMINHSEMKIPVKTDIYSDVDYGLPLYINGNATKEQPVANVMWSSIISPYSANLQNLSAFYTNKASSYGYMANYPIATTFQILYGKGIDPRGMVAHGQVMFKNLDTAKYVRKVNGVFQPDNCFTSQVTVKRQVPIEQLKKKMISNMEECFGLKTGWEKSKKKCLIISRSNYPITEYKEGETTLWRSGFGTMGMNINKLSIAELIDSFVVYYFFDFPYPIIDETGFKGKLGNIKFKSDKYLSDYKILGQELVKYGMQFSIEEREVDVLVIEGATK